MRNLGLIQRFVDAITGITFDAFNASSEEALLAFLEARRIQKDVATTGTSNSKTK